MTTLKVPGSLAEEHRELFHELRDLAKKGNETGKAVKKLLATLEPHFEREDETAMPLLAVLEPLSKGRRTGNTADVMRLHDEFSSEYPSMLEEHARIKDLIGNVRRAAIKKRELSVLALMKALEHHAAVEEEVLYPAAMLVGIVAKANAEEPAR